MHAFPLTASQLKHWMFVGEKWLQRVPDGNAIQQRRGQSLEFREFREYQLGDDARHIDWRASLKYGRPASSAPHESWRVRTFHSEERLSILVVLDNRPELVLPTAIPKREVGAWLVQALCRVAALEDNTVRLACLFGEHRPVSFDRPNVETGLARFLESVNETRKHEDSLNPHLLRLASITTSIVILVSDLYFDEETQLEDVAQFFRGLQSAYRKLIVAELDSWPMERKELRNRGPVRIVNSPEAKELILSERQAQLVDETIDGNRRNFMAMAGNPASIRWEWPESESDAKTFFKERFFDSKGLWPLLRRSRC